MGGTRRFKIGVALLAAATALHIVAYLVAQSEHIVDATWPEHARFHTLQALIWIVGLDATLLIVILGPLRAGRRGALPVLAFGGLTAQGAYFVAMIMLPEGRPPEWTAHLALAFIAGLFVTGLALAWRDGRS